MKSRAWVLPILVVLAGLASLLVIAPLIAAVSGSVALDKAFVKSVGGALTITLNDADLDVGISQTEAVDENGDAYTTVGKAPNTDFAHFVQKLPIQDANGDGSVNRPDVTITGVASGSVSVMVVDASNGRVTFQHDGTAAGTFSITYTAADVNTIDVLVASTQDTGGFTLTLTETGAVSGVFEGTFGTGTSTTATPPIIATVTGGLVTVSYSDGDPAGTRVANATVEDILPSIGDMSPADASASRTQVQKLVAFVTDSDSGMAAGDIAFTLVDALNDLGVSVVVSEGISLGTITTSAITGGFKAEVDVNEIPAGETTITWTVTASDVAGNSDTTDVQTFKVDTVSPDLATPIGAITGQFWDAAAGPAAIEMDAGLASTNSIRIIFNEALDGSVDVQDFEVDGDNPIAAEWFAGAPESVFLTVPAMLPDATPVIALVGELADTAGNVRSTGGDVSAKDGIAPGNDVAVAPSLSVDTVQIDVSSNEPLLGSPSIKVNAVGLQTAKIGDKKWRATFTTATAGKYAIETTTTDPVGNARIATLSFEIDNALPDPPAANLKPTGNVFRNDPFVEIGWTTEADEYGAAGDDTHPNVMFIAATLDGDDVLARFSTTDNQTYIMATTGLAEEEHTVVVTGQDDVGNEKEITFTFTVVARPATSIPLSPGWNLVSLPGRPIDSSINAVITVAAVDIVMTFDRTAPGLFATSFRDPGTLLFDTDELSEMTEQRAYWVHTSTFEPLTVDIAPVGGGVAAPPPEIRLSKGWNLLSVVDITGAASTVVAGDYLKSVPTATISRIYGYSSIDDRYIEVTLAGDLTIGRGYWIYLTASAVLVP